MPAGATHHIVVGLGYGDEGKGSTVDYLASSIPNAAAVVRFSSGPQAAHTVRHGARMHTFRQFGSGSLLGLPTYLLRDMAVNPMMLAVESEQLERLGVTDALGRITADSRSLVITPLHQLMNHARELLRGGDRHGTTGNGVGETVAYDLMLKSDAKPGDLIGNFPIHAPFGERSDRLTMGTLRSKRQTMRALDQLAKYAAPLLRQADIDLPHSIELIANALCSVASSVRIEQSSFRALEREVLAQGAAIFEGSQGALLDENYGFHPHTTWATVVPNRLRARLRALGQPSRTVGVTRTYATRHGQGPMPTEDTHLDLPEPDNGDDGPAGRWRVGHLDLHALTYAANIVRPDELAITHLDVDPSRLMVATDWGDRSVFFADSPTEAAFDANPTLEPAPTDRDELIAMIERAAHAPATILSTGPTRLDRTERRLP